MINQHIKKNSIYIIILLSSFIFSCNRFNKSYNEIPPLPEANDDFASQHIEVLNKLIKDDDENDELYWQRSIIYQKLGKPEEALSDIKRAVNLNKNKYHYYKTLAQAYLLNQRYDSAIRAATLSRSSGNDDYQLNLILAEAYLNQGKFKESLAEIDEALTIDPSNYYTYYLRGLAYKNAKDTVSYKENFLTAMKMNPDDKNVYYELLNYYLSIDNHSQANDLLSKMFTKFTPDVEMHKFKASFFEKQNKLDSAYNNYKIAFEKDSTDYEISMKLGDIKVEKKDYLQAIQHYKDVLNIKSDNFAAQLKLAGCYENLRNLPQALSEFEKAKSMDSLGHTVDADIARVNLKLARKQQLEREKLENERRVILLPELPKKN